MTIGTDESVDLRDEIAALRDALKATNNLWYAIGRFRHNEMDSPTFSTFCGAHTAAMRRIAEIDSRARTASSTREA